MVLVKACRRACSSQVVREYIFHLIMIDLDGFTLNFVCFARLFCLFSLTFLHLFFNFFLFPSELLRHNDQAERGGPLVSYCVLFQVSWDTPPQNGGEGG